MTLVNLTGLEASVGTPTVLTGTVKVQRWAGGAPAVTLSGEKVIFSPDVTIALIGGEPSVPLALEPTTDEWHYRITVADSLSPRALTVDVAVPDQTSIDFDDLPRVDPSSGLPLVPGTQGVGGLPGLHQVTVSGVTSLAVLHEHTYELNATAAATVTLTGVPGCHVAVVWSGTAGSLEGAATAAGGTYVAVRLTAGWKIFTVGGSGDTTAPTPGTLTSSAITSSGFTLTISGASDAGGLHATPYAFSTDNGVTWSAYQASASFNATGLTATTGYACKGRVRDAAGNTADTPAQTVTTTSAGATWQTVAKDSFNGTDGTALTAHTSETGGVTYTGSQAGPKILSNKVDIYPYGGDQNAVSSSTTGLGSKFRASLGYVIPSTHGDYLRLVSLTVRDGVSAANGAGQFHAKVGIDLPSANSANGGLSGTSTYDGALTLTPVGGQNLNLVPLSGTLGISVDAGVLSVLINGTVWATVAAPSGCSFGSSVLWAMEPAGLYNGPHWQADDYLVEKYA